MSAKEITNTILFQHLVKKQFTKEILRYRESMGTALAILVEMSDQKMVLSNEELMVEKVAGITLSHLGEQLNDELKEQVCVKLAEKMVEIRDRHRQKKQITDELFESMSYKNLLRRCRKELEQIGGEDLIEELSRVPLESLTICHGDLNLSNLMLLGDKLTLIDFEHVVEAPMAFDFGSAVLFNDQKSMDFMRVIKNLKKMGIAIEKDDLMLGAKLYLADQMNKANKGKQQLLTILAKEKCLIL